MNSEAEGQTAAPDAGASAADSGAGYTVPKEKFEEERSKLKAVREQAAVVTAERDALAVQVAELSALRGQVEELGAAKAQAADFADQLALARAGFADPDAYVVAKALHAAKAADRPFGDFVADVIAHPSLQAFRAAPTAAAPTYRPPTQAGSAAPPTAPMAIDAKEAAAKARAGDRTAWDALQKSVGESLASKANRR